MDTEIASSRQAALRQAFEDAEYHVLAAGNEWLVRTGERHAALDRALGCKRWTIITAHNPGGRRSGARQNQLRDKGFRTEVARQGWRAFEAVGRDPAGDWPDEPGLLIVDVPTTATGALARRFGQAATLTARAGEAARVAFLDTPDTQPWSVG